jgi:Tfp pilus assembly protein PilV
MNPGPSEEIGQTARSFFEVMKGQPALLALVIANMALLGFMYYALQSAAASRNQLVTQILDNSNAIHLLLQQRSISCPDPKEKPP